MENLVYDWIGGFHLITSIISLITGTLILAMKKGTKIHIKIRYIYAVAMFVVVATAFMIYRLFDGFGIFHSAATVSGVTLAGGMIPAILRKPKNWLNLHFSFMYWSVMGLYMAFASEVLTRIPETPFLRMIGIATAAIGIIGGSWFYYRKNSWAEEFANSAAVQPQILEE